MEVTNETWLSRYGKVIINFSNNPLKHEFVFVEMPNKPKIVATDYFAALSKMARIMNNENIN